MADEQDTTQDPRDSAKTDDAKKDGEGGGRNEVVDAVIGLAVLGLGAAVVSGGLGLGGIVRTLTRGVPSGTPPIAPRGVPGRYYR